MGIKASSQVTVVDVTDAYSVTLTSEAYTFIGNTVGAPSGLSCTTQAVAYRGAQSCSTVTIGTITCPTGISATISNNNTSAPVITFDTTATITSACEATIPVTIDGITIIKKFSFAVAKTGTTGATGATGTSIESTTRYYQIASSYNAPAVPTTFPPDSVWSTVEPSYSFGAINSLYFVDATKFTDGTYKYSEVSKSSTYEAAKEAYNKATSVYKRVLDAEAEILKNKEGIALRATKTEVSERVTTDVFNSFKEQTEAELSLMSDKVSISVYEEQMGVIKDDTSDLRALYNELRMNYDFTADGQYIGKKDSDTVLRLVNDMLQILVAGIAVTTVDTRGLNAFRANVSNIVMGDYVLSVDDNCLVLM
mgnify:CR=1 FL=1